MPPAPLAAPTSAPAAIARPGDRASRRTATGGATSRASEQQGPEPLHGHGHGHGQEQEQGDPDAPRPHAECGGAPRVEDGCR